MTHKAVTLKPNSHLDTILRACWTTGYGKGHSYSIEQLPPECDIDLLSLDPGETTGLCQFYQGNKSLYITQLDTPTIETGLKEIEPYIKVAEHVRMEDYKVYAHKAGDHAGLRLHTSELIGCIKTLCTMHSKGYSLKLAMHAKQFWTDEKLKAVGLYTPGLKHGRDALRHALFYLAWPKQ